MKGTLALLALAGVAFTSPVPQGVTDTLTPDSPAPAGCMPDYPGTFQITVTNVSQSSAKRSIQRRQQDGILTLTLSGGVMKDQAGRTGYIAANDQFQFDDPPQTGAVYTAGWSVCANGSIALGGSAIFYQCLSGNFYNLYDTSQGGQCAAIYISVIGGGSQPATQVSVMSDGQPQPTSVPVTVISDGQPQATTGAPVSQISDGQIQNPVTQISDGQIQAPAVTQISDGQIQAPPVTQISDGQVQATGAPVTQISDGQVQASTGAPVTQISDGQVQATTGAPVTQISDGQVQATTGAPVTQISDGQVQATTGAPVTQISDGQVQATTGAPVTQISDGQVQATTGAPVTQISDGQVQATTAVATFTGGAPRELAGSFAFVAGIVGAVAML